MPDLTERFRMTDDLSAPDLSAAIEQRLRTSGDERTSSRFVVRRVAGSRISRGMTIATALAAAAVATALVVVAFSGPRASSPADGGSSITRIPVRSPGDVTLAGGSVWVTTDGPAVTEIDAGSGAILRTLPVSRPPVSIVGSADAVWIQTSGALQRIDPITGETDEPITFDRETTTMLLDEGSLWVGLYAGSGDNAIVRLDATTGQLVATIPIRSDPEALAAGPHVMHVFGTDYQVRGYQTLLTTIDVSTNTVESEVESAIPLFDGSWGLETAGGLTWQQHCDQHERVEFETKRLCSVSAMGLDPEGEVARSVALPPEAIDTSSAGAVMRNYRGAILGTSDGVVWYAQTDLGPVVQDPSVRSWVVTSSSSVLDARLLGVDAGDGAITTVDLGPWDPSAAAFDDGVAWVVATDDFGQTSGLLRVELGTA